MKNSKETRTCIGCKKKDNKYNLIRISLKDNKAIYDLNQRAGGRGIYLCKNEECLKKVLKNKSLKLSISEEDLRGVVFGK